MELKKAIKLRRTLHSFNQKKVSENVIERAIELANYAPCHRLTFPWRFTQISLPQRKSLVKLAIQIKFSGRTIDSTIQDQMNSKFLDPSHLIVATQILTNDSKRKLEDYAACACAIQNLLLSLIDDGVGSKWSTGEITTHNDTYKIVGVDPFLEKIIGFIWIGYGAPPSMVNRPAIKSVFRIND